MGSPLDSPDLTDFRKPVRSELDEAIPRRTFLKQAILSALTTTTAANGGLYYVKNIEPYHPVVERLTLALPSLPAAADGLRLAQLSDLHMGRSIRPEDVARGVALVNAERPDLIVVTGDYVTGDASYAEPCARELGRLQAPLGVWAILGNHDKWTRSSAIIAALQAAGLRVLVNRALPPIPSVPLWLIGLDDIWSGKPNLPASVADLPPEGCRILLAHEPDFADEAARPDYRIALQLSGHSHGGQVRLPVVGAPVLPYLGRKYDQGLRRVGDMWLYTNRGLGMVEPAVRFNCPPEVTLFTLRQEKG